MVNAMSDRPQIQFSMRDAPELPSYRTAGAQVLPDAATASGENDGIIGGTRIPEPKSGPVLDM
jgi:hypothetical protein